ncbi:MAG: dodecin domain-containing protein [Porticoccaceae bacterium]|jgi:flavin-binding protein dodecin|nr:MAG: dodecin domain-containing protein [Porticoccaceae bacterium]
MNCIYDPRGERIAMTVSSVSTLTASSPESWQDALVRGVARARKTLRGIHRVEVIAERALVERGEIKNYEVELKIIFSLDD